MEGGDNRQWLCLWLCHWVRTVHTTGCADLVVHDLRQSGRPALAPARPSAAPQAPGLPLQGPSVMTRVPARPQTHRAEPPRAPRTAPEHPHTTSPAARRKPESQGPPVPAQCPNHCQSLSAHPDTRPRPRDPVLFLARGRRPHTVRCIQRRAATGRRDQSGGGRSIPNTVAAASNTPPAEPRASARLWLQRCQRSNEMRFNPAMPNAMATGVSGDGQQHAGARTGLQHVTAAVSDSIWA